MSDYDMVKHSHSATAIESAQLAHIPGHQLAKAVVLEDANGYVVSVIAVHQPSRSWSGSMKAWDGSSRMAPENELPELFSGL